MKIAYLILAHTNLSQLSLLIDLLTVDTDNHCFIHVDARLNKASTSHFLSKKNASDRYSIIERSFNIKWGGYSMIEATLELIRVSLMHADKYDYLSLHSGMDLPLKSNEYIDDHIFRSQSSFFMEYFKIPNYDKWPKEDGGNIRIKYYWFVEQAGTVISDLLFKIQKKAGLVRVFQSKIDIYGGSQWWTISRACADYVLTYVNNNTDFCNLFKYALIPDELFFNTIIANSTFTANGHNGNLRFIEWEPAAGHPKIFGQADFDRLITGNSLYARKFDINFDMKIFLKIIDHISNRVSYPVT